MDRQPIWPASHDPDPALQPDDELSAFGGRSVCIRLLDVGVVDDAGGVV